MSNPSSGLLSTPTIYGKVDYGPTFGAVFRPLNPKRLIVEPGNFEILPFDVIVIVKQTPAAAFTCQLPDLRRWMTLPLGGFDLILKNRNLGFDGTFVGFGSQTVDGLPSITVGSAEGGGALVLCPLNDMSGWVSV